MKRINIKEPIPASQISKSYTIAYAKDMIKKYQALKKTAKNTYEREMLITLIDRQRRFIYNANRIAKEKKEAKKKKK